MPEAFRATYSDLKLIKTRKCVQIIFEIPQEDFDAAYEVLGGLPNPAAERWFGIAALRGEMEVAQRSRQEDPKLSAGKREWRDISPVQQAGIRCAEPAFSVFLKESYPDDWHESAEDAAECVRMLCRILSRSELATSHKAGVIWKQLDDEFIAWKALEHA